jgi:chromate reductase, NAD(P)H dehydrogenase (quinone)
MLRVIGIAGSLRRESFNRKLLGAAVELAPSGMDICIERELGAIPLFDADLATENPKGPMTVQKLRDKVAAADGVLISTPEYNQSFPGVLKNLIDWLSLPAPAEVLQGKPVATVGASSGPWGTRLAQAALRQVLFATESRVLPGPQLFVRDCQTRFDSTGRLVDQRTRDQLVGLLQAFESWIMPGMSMNSRPGGRICANESQLSGSRDRRSESRGPRPLRAL